VISTVHYARVLVFMLPATEQLFQRTVPDASELLETVENAIRDQLIPALVG